ncbi:type II toxin-antitoxin system VapC family toxin [Sinimarinibacterium thermocellulolyticum]|uniref:Type II toxin-antitoxin system VapC family toxin n=1 Tax=Sinimarinibacterium thermocellulolyticum TaxID=3170016 RepID=A0ABV2ADE1_9GAMM
MSALIGLDTNVLARYYVEDATDAEATRQRFAARRLIESGVPLKVCKTVLLELEWVLRGYYRFSATDIAAVFAHLLGRRHIEIEDRNRVEQALRNYASGLDFADALHHASYGDCASMASFDDRRFARRAKRLGLMPSVKKLT